MEHENSTNTKKCDYTSTLNYNKYKYRTIGNEKSDFPKISPDVKIRYKHIMCFTQVSINTQTCFVKSHLPTPLAGVMQKTDPVTDRERDTEYNQLSPPCHHNTSTVKGCRVTI